MAFPTNILALADAIGSQFLNLFHGGTVSHSDGTNQMLDDLIAVETKLGTGASTATANTVLRGTGSGTTAFGQVVGGDVSSSAALSVASVVTSAATTANSVNVNTTGAAAGEVKTGAAIKAGTGIYPSGQTNVFLTAPKSQFSVPISSSEALTASLVNAMLLVTDLTQGASAVYSLNGGFATTTLLAGSSSIFVDSGNPADRISVFHSGGLYYVHNGFTASAHVISIAQFSM